ncbi:MAG: hypothetical protein ABIN95_03490 [Mucilaginibacter sp.]
MKKFLTLVLLIGVAMVASSCKKEITQVIQPNQTIIFNVQSGDWQLNQAKTTYFTTLDDIPEIDNYFHENGGVLVYGMFENGIYEQFPQVYDGISYSYSYVNGSIEIDAQLFDGSTYPESAKPGAVKVKVILVDSQP